MKHLDDGELRRTLDEPDAFSAEHLEHAAQCPECCGRRNVLAGNASAAEDALAGNVRPDAARAYARVRERSSAPPALAQWYRSLAIAGVAAAFLLALVFTPLGGYARSFLTVFEPRQFQPIEVSRADLRDLRLLPQADDVGTQRVVRKPQLTHYASISAAQSHASFALVQAAALPPHFGTVHAYSLRSPGEMTFTFDANKARAFERRSHKTLAPMPAGLDGTTVRLQTGQVFNAHYEAAPASAGKRKAGTPFLEIVEAAAPRVTSTGASLDTLERYLLSMPNVSPNLAAQIRALGDIQNTIPVPVVIDKQTARAVTIRGVKGLAIGDNTGLGAGVMWEKDGTIYIVAGPLSMDQIMTVANGLR